MWWSNLLSLPELRDTASHYHFVLFCTRVHIDIMAALTTPDVFNCFICTKDEAEYNATKLYRCRHKLCDSCAQTIMQSAYDRGELVAGEGGPKCPFCRSAFLFGLAQIADIKMVDHIYDYWIGIRRHGLGNDLSYFVVCNNRCCEERFLVNKQCICEERVRYVYFHHDKKFLTYM